MTKMNPNTARRLRMPALLAAIVLVAAACCDGDNCEIEDGLPTSEPPATVTMS